MTRRLPTFLVIGAMKAGTTSLYHYLASHPQVHMSRVKEVDFFTEGLNWARGWDWYHRQFEDAPADALALGEASTSYTKYPRFTGIPERIAAAIPDVKLVYSVRDPVARIRSHYQHNRRLGQEDQPLERALHTNPNYLDYSRYAMQIERYLEHFPRDQLLVITNEALRDRREETVRKVLAFIGVDASIQPGTLDQEFYKTDERPELGPVVSAVRGALRRLFPDRAHLWRGEFLPERVRAALGRKEQRRTGVEVTPEVGDAIATALREDVRRLRPFVEEEFDGWGIA